MAQEKVPFKASSHIQDVLYDPDTRQLVVVFPNASYAYEGVDQQAVTDLSQAESAGSYLHTQIKPLYPATKL